MQICYKLLEMVVQLANALKILKKGLFSPFRPHGSETGPCSVVLWPKRGEQALSNYMALRHELIPNPMHRKDMPRLITISLHLLAESSYVVIDGTGCGVGVVPPDFI